MTFSCLSTMESIPSLETVCQAVATLYHSPTDKEKASHWLGELQRSIYAWKIADQLLREYKDVEPCYFAAQTLRTKMQTSFNELPPTSHQSLRDSLIDHLQKVTDETNSAVVTQLCLALATLALQMTTWQKPVLDLIQLLGTSKVLLEVLTVLPEEVTSRSLRLGENRRTHVIEELKECAQTVCNLLNMCLGASGDNVRMHVQILRCYDSWLTINAIPIQDVGNSVILQHAFNIVTNHQNEQAHEAATDCICTVLQYVDDEQQLLERQLFNKVMVLEEAYHMSVAHENTERSLNFCRIFTELGESYLERIVRSCGFSQTHFAIGIFDLVLICVGHYDYEVAAITFNLWSRLSEELYRRNDDGLTAIFQPYVERLIASLCRHARIESDHEGLLDDHDEFADFRSKVAELIKDVAFIVGSSNCFRQMFLDLQTPGVTWDQIEAALFVMQAVAKNVIPQEDGVVPKVLEAILNLPESTHIAVRHTSLLLVGELCEWIEHHPQTLEPALNFLLVGLQHPQLASASASALQSICSSCRKKMISHCTGLIQIVQALNSLNLKNTAATGLLKGITIVLSLMPASEMETALRSVCSPQLAVLEHLAKSPTIVSYERDLQNDPAVWLDRLAIIFRHCTVGDLNKGQKHPGRDVFTDLLPALNAVLDRYQNEHHIVERWCRCVRFAVRSVGQQSSHLLAPIAKQIVSLYAIQKHSSFLYLGSILVDEYACDATCRQQLEQMLADFIQPTFQTLQEPGAIKNNPDTVEDFFRLCSRYLQRLPLEFLQCPALPDILECALLCCTLDHRDANAAVMKFFTDLISTNDRKDKILRTTLQPLVSAILEQHGQRLVCNLLQASIYSLQSYMLNSVADVITELFLFNREKATSWLEQALTALQNTSNAGVVMTATPQQIGQFMNALISSQSVKATTHSLRDFARLYR